ncbi:unnamed protein product [Withania somnifera]
MGRGKGNPTGWIARVSRGQILFEMDGVSLSNARQAATLAAHKLCSSTKFVRWSIVHGTTIEILRTIFPSIIPMFIVVVDPDITIKAIGHQWYRSAPLHEGD